MNEIKEYKPLELDYNVKIAVENLKTAYWSNEPEKVAKDFTEAEDIIISAICHHNYILSNERPQGEWATERKYYDDFLKNIIYECSCSVCGARFPFAQIPETTQDAFYSFNYCPACGAKMRTDAD